MKIILTPALAGALFFSVVSGAMSGPLSISHLNWTASPMASVEWAYYRGHYHHRYHHHRPYHHNYYRHYAWGPRVFSVANEWRCNPLYHTECFYPGPYVEFPQFYQ